MLENGFPVKWCEKLKSVKIESFKAARLNSPVFMQQLAQGLAAAYPAGTEKKIT
jgi:hypothetical protein